MRPRVVVVGSANTDFVVQVPEIPVKGETVLGGKFVTARGGKGANQAVAAARLGGEVTFVARLGRDSLGQEAAEAYAQEGIDVSCIAWDEVEPSGVALIIVSRSGDNIIAVAPGANARLSPEDVLRAENAIATADCLLLQLEIPLATVQTAVDLAKRRGVRVVLNPAPAARLPQELLRKVDILTPNETEARALAGESDGASVDHLAAQLMERSGARKLVITLGARGALVLSDGKAVHVPAFPIQPVDSTASGDAFNGALAVALGRGQNLAAAVRFASAAGALTATRFGAQPSLPTLHEVEEFTGLAVAKNA